MKRPRPVEGRGREENSYRNSSSSFLAQSHPTLNAPDTWESLDEILARVFARLCHQMRKVAA
jgi:hypothetical protein